MNLRPYQTEAISKIYKSFDKHSNVMFQLPTGGGKTVVLTQIAKDHVERGITVMVLVHRYELITQTAHKFLSLGLHFSIIQAEHRYVHGLKLYIASVQTLSRRLGKTTLPKDVGLIIVDEAHHATADSYNKIYEYYPNAKILGVSATPVRTDGKGFSKLFTELVPGVTVKKLMDEGFLVKPKIFAPPKELDFKGVKVSKGDYDSTQALELLEQNYSYGDFIESWKTLANGKRTVAFAINVNHSKTICEAYNNAGIKARHIDGETPPEERKTILRLFSAGQIDVLCNVGIVTEGFDLPAIECVQLIRPTKSLSLYLQMVGRGLRPMQGKTACIILDHVNCVKNHGLPEADRVWSLEGVTKKKANKMIMYRDLATGKEYEPDSVPQNIKHVELVEVDYDPARYHLLDKLITEGKKRGFKPGWAWHSFVKKYNQPTKSEILRFEKLAGYKTGWAWHKLQEYNLA